MDFSGLLKASRVASPEKFGRGSRSGDVNKILAGASRWRNEIELGGGYWIITYG